MIIKWNDKKIKKSNNKVSDDVADGGCQGEWKYVDQGDAGDLHLVDVVPKSFGVVLVRKTRVSLWDWKINNCQCSSRKS